MFADLDPVLLARIQFALTIGFHIVFPSFTIGLSAWIAHVELMWARTGARHYADISRLWTRVFAASFAMGVVSGIVMSYQFGTNWSRFSVVAGNVVGPLLGYEVLTAFFLEATFLGVLLFGRERVPRWLHVFSAVMVALGTLISAFWIISANSWMQWPTGHRVEDGIAIPEDWWAIVFNPTFPLRLAHMAIAAYLATAIVVLAVGADHLLRGIDTRPARIMVRMGLGMALVLAPLQLLVGDLHGLDAAKYQPAKIAAVEAHWDGSKPAPLVLFALPDGEAEENRYELAIPNLASLIITRDWNGTFPGLKDFARTDRPPLAWPFFAFRLMVGIGLWLIALVAWGGALWARGALFSSRLYLRLAYWSWPLGFIAILAGWTTAEVGRQPWLVTGLLRTAEAASPVPAGTVLASLVAIILVYAVVFGVGIVYINRMLRRGIDGEAPMPMPSPPAPPAEAGRAP